MKGKKPRFFLELRSMKWVITIIIYR